MLRRQEGYKEGCCVGKTWGVLMYRANKSTGTILFLLESKQCFIFTSWPNLSSQPREEEWDINNLKLLPLLPLKTEGKGHWTCLCMTSVFFSSSLISAKQQYSEKSRDNTSETFCLKLQWLIVLEYRSEKIPSQTKQHLMSGLCNSYSMFPTHTVVTLDIIKISFIGNSGNYIK